MLRLSLLICCLILVAPSYGAVEEAFTVGTAVETTLERYPNVQMYRERIVEDHSNFNLAIAKVFPSVSLQGTSNYLKNPASLVGDEFEGQAYNEYDVNLTLNQPIWDGGALLAGYKYAKKDLDIRQKELEATERDTTLLVLQAFYGVVLNQHLMQVLQDDYDVQKDILNIMARYLKIGRVQKLDILQQQTAVALLPPQIAATDDALKTNASALATYVRALNGEVVRVKGQLVCPSLDWVKQTHDRSKEDIPQLVSSRIALAQFQDTRDITMATYNPKLSFVGTVGRQSYTRTDLLDDNNTSWTIGLQLNIPLFAGLSSVFQDRVLQSQYNEQERTDVGLNDAQAALIITSEKDLEVAKSTLDFDKIAADLGRASLNEADRQWRQALINYLQYQTSQQAYLTAETNYFQAQYNYIIAIGKYFVATGTPLRLLVAELDRLTGM